MESLDWMKPGNTVMVMGPNDDYVGEIVAHLPGRVVAMRNASWVSQSGRYLSTFVAKGKADGMEIEPVGDIVTTWNDIIRWPHKLFTERV